jgi:hypothetical protein
MSELALTRATGEGGSFGAIKEALMELSRKEAKVVFKVHAIHDERPMEKGPVEPVDADMVVCTGPHKGKVLRNYQHIGKGITGPLRRAFVKGEKEVAARLQVLKNGATDYPGAQTPNDDDFELIENFYGDGSKVWNGPDLVEVETASSSSGLSKAGNSDNSDAPPF